jgi:hypothetical protein
MKRSRLFQISIFVSLCIGFAVWTIHASGQGAKDAGTVEQEAEGYMPLLKGEQWLKLDPNSKVAFIWGAAHIILIENILMEEFPELKVQNFSAKAVEARTAKMKAGTKISKMTINETVSAIDQHYKDHPEQRNLSVIRVIWDIGFKPYLKTGIAGRPLK